MLFFSRRARNIKAKNVIIVARIKQRFGDKLPMKKLQCATLADSIIIYTMWVYNKFRFRTSFINDFFCDFRPTDLHTWLRKTAFKPEIVKIKKVLWQRLKSSTTKPVKKHWLIWAVATLTTTSFNFEMWYPFWKK